MITKETKIFFKLEFLTTILFGLYKKLKKRLIKKRNLSGKTTRAQIFHHIPVKSKKQLAKNS